MLARYCSMLSISITIMILHFDKHIHILKNKTRNNTIASINQHGQNKVFKTPRSGFSILKISPNSGQCKQAKRTSPRVYLDSLQGGSQKERQGTQGRLRFIKHSASLGHGRIKGVPAVIVQGLECRLGQGTIGELLECGSLDEPPQNSPSGDRVLPAGQVP